MFHFIGFLCRHAHVSRLRVCQYFREKLSSLSEFMREIKVGFERYYNRRHDRRGYFWGDRFKSLIVENGETLINCLTYIDMNPLRVGLVDRPEEYRWNSAGYHIQTQNLRDSKCLQ